MIDAIDEGFRPGPMSPARRTAFHDGLEVRLAAGARSRRWVIPLAAASAAAAAFFWLALPEAAPPHPNAATVSELDAFVDPDALAAELTERADYLPGDYRYLVRILDVDEGAR